jgi:hypothetical protein
MGKERRCLAAAWIVVLTATSLGACNDDKSGSAPAVPAVTGQPSANASPAVSGHKTRRNWVLVSLSADKKNLTLRWDHRACGKTPQVDKSEVADAVEILTSDYVEDVDCKAKPQGSWQKVQLGLDKPLGGRPLVGCTPDRTIDCRKDWTRS